MWKQIAATTASFASDVPAVNASSQNAMGGLSCTEIPCSNPLGQYLNVAPTQSNVAERTGSCQNTVGGLSGMEICCGTPSDAVVKTETCRAKPSDTVVEHSDT